MNAHKDRIPGSELLSAPLDPPNGVELISGLASLRNERGGTSATTVETPTTPAAPRPKPEGRCVSARHAQRTDPEGDHGG